MKKWDRVEFTVQGEVKVGTAASVGKKTARVVIDGMEQEYGVPVSMLRPSQTQPPKDEPSPIDRWGLAGYKEAGGEETVRFECYVTYDGKKVLIASNGGTGGCNHYSPLEAGGMKHLDRLRKDVEAAVKQFGGKEKYEPEDCWLGWKASFSRFLTFRQYLAQWDKDD